MAGSSSLDIRGLVAQPPLHPASFDRLNPDRFDHLYLYYEGDGKGDDQKQNYRYRLTVVDRTLLPTTSLAFSAAVFLIPAGREAEYVFSSKKGLISIAESAHCGRLIVVTFGRTSTFPNQEFVQNELTYVVQILSRQAKFLPPFLYKKFVDKTNIPFMASDGIGSRNVLAKGETSMSGDYLVEQCKVEDRILRRLYFMENPFVIQSEVALLGETNDDKVNKSNISFEYHKSIVAGMAAMVTTLGEQNNCRVCVIGLGGGGLLNFLQHALPNLQLTAVELDPSVVEIAEKYFGVEQNDSCKVVVGDGLEVRPKEKATKPELGMEPGSFSALVIDVDSKDKTVGMSCPPAAFCTVEYLTRLKALLKPEESVLAINVSARDPDMARLVFCNVQSVFGSVFVSTQDDSDGDDDEAAETNGNGGKAVNVSLLATPNTITMPASDIIAERIDRLFSKELVAAELRSDFKSCDMTEWVDESSSTGKASGGNKNRKKKKSKKGKRK